MSKRSLRVIRTLLKDLLETNDFEDVEAELNNLKRNRKANVELLKIFFSCDGLSSLLLDYLSFRDIAKLDSAINNHDLRLVWLQSLSISCCQNEKIIYLIRSDNMISWCALKNIHFKAIKLDQSSCHHEITDIGLYILSQYSENLIQLHLYYLQMVSEEGLTRLATGCPKLQILEAEESICNETMKLFSETCKHLTDITIIEARDVEDEFNDNSIITLLNNCPLLQKFHFFSQNSPFLNIESFYALSKKSLLTSVEIQGVNINIRFIQKLIGNHMKFLQTLRFDRIVLTDNILCCIGQNCPLLKSLALFHLQSHGNNIIIDDNDDDDDDGGGNNRNRLTNSGIIALTKGCPLLIQLDIQTLSTHTDDDSVIAIVQNCPLLQEIRFRGFHIATIGFTELGKLQQLIKLYIHGTSQIDDVIFSSFFIYHNGLLKEIQLPAQSKFSDDILQTLVNFCPDLETFQYRSSTRFGDTSIADFVFRCTKLHYFAACGKLPKLLQDEINRRNRRISKGRDDY